MYYIGLGYRGAGAGVFNFWVSTPLGDFDLDKWKEECVASLIGLYKNKGAVSCVRINFVIFSHFTLPEHSDE